MDPSVSSSKLSVPPFGSVVHGKGLSYKSTKRAPPQMVQEESEVIGISLLMLLLPAWTSSHLD